MKSLKLQLGWEVTIKTVITATRPEPCSYFFSQMPRKLSEGSFFSTNYGKILLVEKYTCQVFTKGKRQEDTL